MSSFKKLSTRRIKFLIEQIAALVEESAHVSEIHILEDGDKPNSRITGKRFSIAARRRKGRPTRRKFPTALWMYSFQVHVEGMLQQPWIT